MTATAGLSGTDWAHLVLASADAIDEHAEELSRLDAAGGDGDHGVNVATAMRHTRNEIAALDDPAPVEVFTAMSRAFLDEMGGAAGALFGSFFRAIARTFKDRDLIDTVNLAEAIEAGTDVVARRGKAEPGDKTMIDALTPAVAAGREAASAETAVRGTLVMMAMAARAGASATTEMTAAVGRARYTDDRSRGVQDPGATTVALIFEAWAAAAEDQSREDG